MNDHHRTDLEVGVVATRVLAPKAGDACGDTFLHLPECGGGELAVVGVPVQALVPVEGESGGAVVRQALVAGEDQTKVVKVGVGPDCGCIQRQSGRDQLSEPEFVLGTAGVEIAVGVRPRYSVHLALGREDPELIGSTGGARKAGHRDHCDHNDS